MLNNNPTISIITTMMTIFTDLCSVSNITNIRTCLLSVLVPDFTANCYIHFCYINLDYSQIILHYSGIILEY